MNRFPRPEAAHGLTMGAVLRIALATVIVSATVTIWLVNKATGWSPVPVLFDQSVPVRDLPKEYSA